MPRRRPSPARQWRKVDLHLHTTSSNDYQEPDASYLDILRQAHNRELAMVAFTDHNTVAGYRALRQEVTELELLERLDRLKPAEKQRLQEYRKLQQSVLVMPGFEFTATFGFHILGLFSPDTPVRAIEHVLLNLNIPAASLDEGSSNAGASADVLTAYREIATAGGIAIAAHANSTHGVAMRGFRFGGQTKVAYTQDVNLHALEVTDLDSRSPRSTARFFNGSKPEYPRRMHCIQGSDAHRLLRDPENSRLLGIGDRITEMHLDAVSFAALKSLLLSHDFSRTRPFRGGRNQLDYVQAAREEGETIVQSFHQKMTKRGGHLFAVIADVCAMANTNGGVVFIGTPSDQKKAPTGVTNISRALGTLKHEISHRITPTLTCSIDTLTTQGKRVARINVPRGEDPPYAIDHSKIYVRDEAETTLAVRDEIVQLTRGRLTTDSGSGESTQQLQEETKESSSKIEPPRTGVEIVATEERDGTRYHTMRDLRNGNQVKNVTRSSARRLWHYAIKQREGNLNLSRLNAKWNGDIGFITHYRKGAISRVDLCQRTPDGDVRVYYGVTEDGMHGPWRKLAGYSE